ncbi:MAG: hypothetical protein JXQ75_04310 [Phycisphaerae bacterium]|nr:hypothetical protein [Phycisphaerae bacterium]
MTEATHGIKVRRVPYPYRAMLAVCSDLDETPNRHVYREIARFLNTTEATSMGQGVGLEVGNTIYFDMPSDQFAYWNTDDAGREMVRSLIRSGHLDCLHSYGDLGTTRGHAGRALDELARHDCHVEVWIDHGAVPTNFGTDIMQGHGDEPGHEAYHADLTCGFGVKYVWRGRVTSVIGQEVRPSLGTLLSADHPIASAQTAAKEMTKHVLGRLGHSKYRMHGSNRVLRPSRLRDGTSVYEFLRSNPHWAGVSSCETGRGIGQVLTDKMLNCLAQREGVCILYTHLGKIQNPRVPLGDTAVAGFRRLADAYREGKILVTTTRRVLAFHRAIRNVRWSVSANGSGVCIDVALDSHEAGRFGGLAEPDLAGLTFYVRDPESARLTLNGREVERVCRNGPDHTGQRSISLSWPRLEFPDV